MTGQPDTRRTFDDLEVGETFAIGPYEMTEARIIEYARSFDPQPMHVDPEAGRTSPLRGLAASGWHTASVLMRLAYDSWIHNIRALGSPGIDRTEWPRKLMADKTIRGEGRILALRVSRKRPQFGLAQIELSVRETGSGDEVIRAVWWLMVERSRMSALESPAADRGKPKPAMPSPPERDAAAVPGVQMLYLGGTEPGEPIYLGEASASEEEILTFARAFDPQPFHLDRKIAQASVLQGLAASGWHTCSLWMRTNVRARLALLADMPESERQRFVHSAAIGLGFDNLSWPRPVRPGDRLHAFMTLLESRESRSRPGWGIARWQSDMTDENGNLVLRFHPSLLMRKP